ncbi:ATP-binding protein [Arsenophonus sp. ENCA]|uniref:ATP-binding protein n=1 Tax=Arsenophonus sp. ENCA TaxID=1987579 RepID=UPI000BCC2644|nr:ATP-binding protein [Arsenophonus sp. ENCA]PAV02125.1 ATP-binding protein [Arsenophonus sp. ENCA]
MSIAILILGESGLGKSTSLRNLDPQKTRLIQCVDKPLPFKSNDWVANSQLNNPGCIHSVRNPIAIKEIMSKNDRDILIIDDYQNSMVGEFVDRANEKGFDKFTDIGKHVYFILSNAGKLAKHCRVYILSHCETDERGRIKMKTIGKMVDQVIVPESYFTIVLRATVNNGNYLFSTQSNGMDCCKSPMGMFNETLIDNDLKYVDDTICAYYGINQTK